MVPFSVSKEQLMHGLQLVHSKLCKNVTGIGLELAIDPPPPPGGILYTMIF